ncbi:hypothetical protein DPEC_G00019290 [Dallia pectoralis]|uniref:Uncharacterized protein n=1 Tax=Dallia pectoralis TaxID=75939 RepID=A0ACC2HGH9_DALPE|nr:hypothetical protein DPEC_G00019290 [Dallia pectoralis]
MSQHKSAGEGETQENMQKRADNTHSSRPPITHTTVALNENIVDRCLEARWWELSAPAYSRGLVLEGKGDYGGMELA